MVSASDLPPNIIQRILEIYYNECTSGVYFDSWKLMNFSAVSAVCQSWRSTSLPLLYRIAICSYEEEVVDGSVFDNPSVDENESQVDYGYSDGYSGEKRYSWETNIRAIIHGGYSQYVKKLRIVSVNCPVDFLGIQPILESSGFDKELWPGITEVEYAEDLSLGLHVFKGVVDILDHQTTGLSRYLCDHIPNIMSFSYVAQSDCDVHMYHRFPFNLLLTEKLSQLKNLRIMSRMFPSISHASFPPNITYLCLGFSQNPKANMNVIPKICAGSLEQAIIHVNTRDYLWNAFYTETKSALIEFSRLKRLCLYFKSSDGRLAPDIFRSPLAQKTKKLLRFPKLEKLHIYGYSYGCYKLLSLFSGPSLRMVSLSEIRINGLSKIDPKLMAQLSSLRVYISYSTNSVPINANTPIYNVLRSAINARIIHISIANDFSIHIPPATQITPGMALRHLHIESLDGIASLYRLVSRHAELDKLTACISFKEFGEDDTFLQKVLYIDYTTNLSQPLNASLRTLQIRFWNGVDDITKDHNSKGRNRLRRICEIILSLPSLRTFEINRCYHKFIMDYLNEHKDKRPFTPDMKTLIVADLKNDYVTICDSSDCIAQILPDHVYV